MNAKTNPKTTATTMKATERVQMPGGPGRGLGIATINQKPIAFKASGKRVLARLRPQRGRIVTVLLAAIASVALAALGPKVLGSATDLIFAGVIGRTLPANITKQQAIDAARAQGQDKIADMMSGVDVVPGQGIDFAAV
ncbi:MAG TPA: ABC transporter ATP-binding protein, partial [Gammaproteobacteria bacterium]|nr:ABC transporter ATP-binding protein [Gammaproteobacteria bacterium]